MKKKSFTIVGAGKVGTTIALLLNKKLKFDYFIDRLVNQEYENLTNKKITTINPIINSDLIFITVPDNYIKSVAQELKIEGDPLIIHFSGALPASEISLDYDKLSLHPMMSIAYPKIAAQDFKNHFITLQGEKRAIDRFKPFISLFSDNYLFVTEEEKIKYHLAAVFSNNFSTILTSIATKLLQNDNISQEKALEIVLPLLNDSFKNLNYQKDLKNSLTGPLVRKDSKTIEKHLSILKDNDAKDIYSSFKNYFEK